jgi:hypothetical protein
LVYKNFFAEKMFMYIDDRAAAVVGKGDGTAENF